MITHGRVQAYRITEALACLYGLLALRYLVSTGTVRDVAFLQSLVLGWAFALTALVARFAPAKPNLPHLRRHPVP